MVMYSRKFSRGQIFVFKVSLQTVQIKHVKKHACNGTVMYSHENFLLYIQYTYCEGGKGTLYTTTYISLAI